MPADLRFDITTLLAFLLVLARVSSTFVFVPLPGMRNAADPAKVVFCVFVTGALFPCWPRTIPSGFGELAGWMVLEAAFGITIGLGVAFLTEAFTLAAQIIGLQAGFSYASTIDPTSQNDTTVLQTIMQLVAGLLYFAGGLDGYVLRAFARSLESIPPGTFHASEQLLQRVEGLGAASFTAALQLSFPVIGLLLLLDLSVALLGRFNAQMQLLSLAFPIKMLGGLAALAALAGLMPSVFQRTVQNTIYAVGGMVR